MCTDRRIKFSRMFIISVQKRKRTTNNGTLRYFSLLYGLYAAIYAFQLHPYKHKTERQAKMMRRQEKI